MENTGFKIVSLKAENFKKLKAVEITPDGSTVVITGKNGAGKSSVLDSIMAALCGKKYCPEKAVRDGAEKGKVTVDMGPFKVIRTFNADGGGSLKVESADGTAASSPQKLLDTIVGDIAFDPMDFVRMGSTTAGKREQRSILMQMAGVDFADLDAKIAQVKSARQVANADKTRLTVELNAAVFTDDLPEAEIEMSALTECLAKAERHNKLVQDHRNEYLRLNGEVLRQTDHIGDIDGRIEHLKKQIAEFEALKAKEVAKLSALTAQRDTCTSEEMIDTAPIHADIAAVDGKNKAIRANQAYRNLKAALTEAQERFSAFGKEVESLEAAKQKRLAEAAFPVPGLSVNEDGVTFNGIPLAQVNTAKQLEIGVAISMKLNPKLRVLRMSGNDLDTDSLAIISKMVEAEGYQAWIEKVSDDGKVGILIEDGTVVEKAQATMFPGG